MFKFIFIVFLSSQIFDKTTSSGSEESSCISHEQYVSYDKAALRSLGLKLKESPCLNGGICVNLKNNPEKAFECRCPPGFIGDLCHVSDPCMPSPCYNGGTCRVYENEATCKCPEGFEGTYCKVELQISPRTSEKLGRSFKLRNRQKRPDNPCIVDQSDGQPACLNEGKCNPIDNLSFWCECREGFRGKFCQFVDACTSSPCQNGGSCESIEDSGVCNCLAGYSGTFCETADYYHKPQVSRSPQASSAERSLKVEDQPDLSIPKVNLPKKSATSTDACDKQPCLNGGSCIPLDDNEFVCHCEDEYTGQFCQFSNACASSPCQNGGTCEPFEDSGLCECPLGYTGMFCETIEIRSIHDEKRIHAVDPVTPKTIIHEETTTEEILASDPCGSPSVKCENQGKCINTGESSYECECTSDFSGDHCQYENPCRDYPCKNGGTCVAFDDSGVCYCPKGYFGTYCEKTKRSTKLYEEATLRPTLSRVWRSRRNHADACDSLQSKCLHGGTCVSYGRKSFECQCSPDFTGELCQFTNACFKNPCHNGGTCESYEDSGICICPNGFRGTHCELIDDTLETQTRVRKGRRFYISKAELERVLDHCDDGMEDKKKPTCLNGGRCNVLDEFSYECQCAFGFTGKFCEFKDLCASSPCLNGAACESFEDSGVCRCRKGFTGRFCEDEEVKVTLMTLDNEGTRAIAVPKERQESILEHIYRSKLPSKHSYKKNLLLQPKRYFIEKPEQKSISQVQAVSQEDSYVDRIKEGVISVPGFEDITKDMVRIGHDGTIYIKKPKRKRSSYETTTVPKSAENNNIEEYTNTDAESEVSSTIPTTTTVDNDSNRRILDASIVKVMPNGEIFLKVLLPKDYYTKPNSGPKIKPTNTDLHVPTEYKTKSWRPKVQPFPRVVQSYEDRYR